MSAENTEEHNIEQIEVSMEAVKEHIDLAKSLQKLMNNEHFKKIFIDKYVETYAARLVRLKGAVHMQDEKNQKNIDMQIQGIGQFNQYLIFIEQEGEMARKALEDLEEDMEAAQEDAAATSH